MRSTLPRYFVVPASPGLPDVGLLIRWCGVLALHGHGQVGVSWRKRLAGVAVGMALLMLSYLIEGDHRVMTRYHTMVRAARRWLRRFAAALS